MQWPLSLRTRLVAIVVVGAVLPLGLAGVWQIRKIPQSGEALLRERLDESLRRQVASIGSRWVAFRSDLLTLGTYAVMHPPSDGAEKALEDGRVTQALARLSASGASALLRSAGGRSDPLLIGTSNASGRAGAEVRAKVDMYDELTGHPTGALDVAIPLDELVRADPAAAGIGAVIAVFDSSGTLLTPPLFDAVSLENTEFTWEGERWLTSRRTLGQPRVTLVAVAPVAPFLEPFAETAQGGIVVLGIVVVVVFGATILLTRRTTQSLQDLAHAARDIASGRYDRHVTVRARDEVGEVAEAFNAMTASLRRTTSELAERRSLAAVGEFASSLAHEVRNPLTSIQLDLQRVEEKVADDPRVRPAVERALRSVARLDATVTGVLQLARSGRLTLERLDVQVPLNAAIADVAPQMQVRGVEIVRQASAEALWVDGDGPALQQLLLNLLLNAVQASPEGGVVRVVTEKAEDAVEVAIQDSGPGLAADARERIFDPLYSTKVGGTGLGLAVSRRIAEAHGGSVSLTSAETGGTVAVLRLPCHAGA